MPKRAADPNLVTLRVKKSKRIVLTPTTPTPTPLTISEPAVDDILDVLEKSLHGLDLIKIPPNRRTNAHLQAIPSVHRNFVRAMVQSPVAMDRLLCSRRRGPSFQAMISALNVTPGEVKVTELFIFRLMVMRLYGFGFPELISDLSKAKTAEDVLRIRDSYAKTHQVGVNSMRAYGDIRFNPKHVPSQVGKLFSQAGSFTALFDATEPPTFESAIQHLRSLGIPYYTAGTLLSWLLCCDLADLELIKPPTAKDLSERLYAIHKTGKGGKGALEGFLKITGIEVKHESKLNGDHAGKNVDELTRDNIEARLVQIHRHLVEEIRGQKVETLFSRPGGCLWYSDLEHCLCKIVRAERY